MRVFFSNACVLICISLMLSACEKPAPLPRPKAQENNKEIIVVTHNGPNTYYIDGENQPAGLEYDLVSLFIKDLGPEYSAKFLIVDNISQVIPSLMKGQAHIAAADLTITPVRKQLVVFSDPYQSVQEKLVYNKSQTDQPKSLKDLIGRKIAVTAGTSYAERLQTLRQKEPDLRWELLTNAGADELLERVAQGSLDYTVADSHIVSMLQNYYPNLGDEMAIGEPEQIAWAFPKKGPAWLRERANQFFARISKDGTLRSLIDRYYGHSDRLNPVDITTFLERTRTILPEYVPIFKQGQELTDIDWRLLAAISYQESHWNRFNTSPTNVRGLMMLTENTADLLGVTDRLDARQSIMGGARYIMSLKDMIPKRIAEPDRTWLALAAYNIGYAHLEDARVLAQRLKLNPDSWADLKKTLPLLNKAEYYTSLKYGYASGGAPVIFVESIRSYHKVLEKYEPQHKPVLPSFNIGSSNPTFIEQQFSMGNMFPSIPR
jgi:membrane-bound lytic murein transglycosylase F